MFAFSRLYLRMSTVKFHYMRPLSGWLSLWSVCIYLCTYDLYSPVHYVLDACISITRGSGRGLGSCAAGFALLNLPKGKSLGRSKPETNSYAQALATHCVGFLLDPSSSELPSVK
jgi:hypothetical protein